jgi:RecB family exonuclease
MGAMGAGEAPIRLKGRIDRIDRRERDGALEWAILDYKAGEDPKSPKSAHLAGDGSFRDLQLPLYGLLAAELEMGEAPSFGYVALGNDAARIGVRTFPDADGELVVRALEEAREIVRKVRRGELFELGAGMPADPILRAIAGEGLLAGAASEGDGEDEGDAEGAA